VHLVNLHGMMEGIAHRNNALHIVSWDDMKDEIYIYEINYSDILEAM